jgi:CHAT domain-containing protein
MIRMADLSDGTRARLRGAIEAGTPNGRLAAALRALESAMDRVQEVAAGGGAVTEALAQAGRGADPATLLRAFNVLLAAQRRALGLVDGPAMNEAFTALRAGYEAGTMPPDQRRLYERNVWTAMAWADVKRANPGVLALEPFSKDELRVSAAMDALRPALMAAQAKMVPGSITPEGLADVQAILEAHRELLAGAGPGKMRPTLCFAMAGAAFAIGRGSQQIMRSREAREAYAEAARLYEEAGEPDDAAAAEDQATWLGFALNADVDGGVFQDLEDVTRGIADPLARAQALARLGRMAAEASDVVGVKRYATAMVAALADAGFPAPDDGTAWPEAWVVGACRRRTGSGVVKLLQRVGDMTLQALSVRHAEACLSDAAAAQRIETTIASVHALESAAFLEMAATEDAIVETLSAYNPALEHAPPPPENAGQAAALALWQRVGALIEATQAEAEPGDGVIAEAAAVVAAARETHQPGLIASAALEQARLLERHGDLSASDAAAMAGETALAADTLQAGALTDPKLFSAYLMLRRHRLGLAARSADSPAVLHLAQGAVQAIEARRDRIHDPFQQGSFLTERTHFYVLAAFAAYKLARWDDLLVVMDLYRSRSALLNTLAPPPDGPEVPALQARLRDATAALEAAEAATPTQRQTLIEQRRAIWSLLSIARLRGAAGRALPALSVAAVQAALAPDEAIVAWLWLAEDVLLVLALDRTRVHAERVILSDRSRTRLNRYVDNVRASTLAVDRLGENVASLTEALLPQATRAFLADAKHLIFSPHRALHLVPFHAARVDGQFLIERATVRYAPSFSSLLLPWTGNRAGGVIAVGVGRFGRPGVPDLHHAEDEARAVAAAWGAVGAEATTLLGGAATRAAFAGLPFDRCRCLHLSTHGTSVLADETGGDPFLSRLYLSDGEVEALTIANLPLRAELVVMSACCSGQRAQALPGLTELPGDDLFGLQGALFEAGAGSVIGALWPFDDETAGKLLPSLHAALARGIAPEVALRDAMCGYLRAPGARGVFYWAPLFMSSISRTSP